LKYDKVNSKKTRFLICIITGVIISACSNTKYLIDNQTLLIDTKVECDAKDILNEDLQSILKQKANQKSLFFFRFYPSVYNTFSKGKGTKFKKWVINHIGSEPILYDETLAEKSKAQLLQYMNNKGYFLATIDKNVITKNKKTKLYFSITANKPYHLNEISYKCDDSDILNSIQHRLKNSVLVKDANFDVQNLENERERITKDLNHTGYYFFEKGNITFEADSALQSNEINLSVSINPPVVFDQTDSSKLILKHKKYIVRNTYIIIDYDYKEVLKNKDEFMKSLDTTKLQENVFLLCKGKPYVNPHVVLNCNYIKNNELYNMSNVEKTKLYLSQNLIFRQTTIDFNDVSTSDSSTTGLLDCFIQISPSTKQSYSVNLEGTSTGGDLGAQAKATYENKNLFHGAEIYNLKIRYLLEQNSLLQSVKNSSFNSREYGFDMSIISPKFILPFASKNITKKYGLRTFVKVGYSYKLSIQYEQPIRYLSFGYISKPSKYLTHYFTPFEINGIQYFNKSNDFIAYIKLHNVEKKYEDYFISSSNYSLVWQNMKPDKIEDYSYFKFFVESAGNTLFALSQLSNRKKVNGSYQMFNTNIAQYVKSDIDYRYYHFESKKVSTAYRMFVGFTIPIGNNTVVPSIKQYFAGGSNSMRAWSSHLLQSTKYKGTDSVYFDATGDVKIEANVEQRFPVFKFLTGAVFTDIGNIWSIANNKKQSIVQFGPDFINNLAVSSGIGLRPNFSFFVLRFDFAVKLRDPSLDANKQWLWAQRAFAWKGNPDWNFTFGIGYPF
jgi:hypothetical protein